MTRAAGPTPPIRAEDFFAGDWRGRGEMIGLTGRTLRSLALTFQSAWSEKDSAFLCDERATYDGGGAMDRHWHVTMDGEGAMLGLEPSQGGRMRIENTAAGFLMRYDRLRLLPGPNVARARVEVWRGAEGRVHMDGWTRAFGLVPLVRTKAVLEPMGPAFVAGELRPANS